MKKLLLIIFVFSLTLSCLSSCAPTKTQNKDNEVMTGSEDKRPENVTGDIPSNINEYESNIPVGDSLESMGAYDGMFEEETGVTVICISETSNAYDL